MVELLTALLLISFVVPIVGPWITARYSGGRIVWIGYITGIAIIVAVVLTSANTGLIVGERISVAWGAIVLLFTPISMIIGAISAYFCKRSARNATGTSSIGKPS